MDRERILTKLGQLDSYLQDLQPLIPKTAQAYEDDVVTRMACERLLHISIECVIDICSVLVSGLKLGPPSEEEDLFIKLAKANVLSPRMEAALRRMRGFRNILVHRYGEVDNKRVFSFLKREVSDFEKFKRKILKFLEK